MHRIIAAAFLALAAAVTGVVPGAVPSAAAQSNSLSGGSAGPVGATRDLSGAIGNGYAPFHIGAFEAYLAKSSFTITERQVAPDGGATGIVASAPNGMPFLFLMRDCGRQGCLFLEAVQPFAPKKIGMPLTGQDINAYNRNSPLQVFMTAEANEEVALRWVMPALAGCADACAHSAVTLYFGAVLNVYEAVSKASKQVLVDAPFETPVRRLPTFAGLAADADPSLPTDRRWSAASAAFGGASIDGLSDTAFKPQRLSARLTEEIRRAVRQNRPAETEFPALIGR